MDFLKHLKFQEKKIKCANFLFTKYFCVKPIVRKYVSSKSVYIHKKNIDLNVKCMGKEEPVLLVFKGPMIPYELLSKFRKKPRQL